jgi:cobalt/nickel transport system permease protein
MHIPDGFIDPPVALAAGAVAAAGVAVCLRGARRTLDEATAPLAGLVAVFIFAGQMINFPVGAGTSGHLMGAALATILVGPYAGALAVTVVLLVQALFFADGGLTALGLNVVNMALISALIAWPVFCGMVRVLGTRRPGIVAAAWLAGALSVVGAAAGFAVEFALGGPTAVDPGTVAAAMLGVHTVIGAVEGAITAAVVWAVVSVRPDLVVGLQGLLRPSRTSANPQAVAA